MMEAEYSYLNLACEAVSGERSFAMLKEGLFTLPELTGFLKEGMASTWNAFEDSAHMAFRLSSLSLPARTINLF